MQYRQMGLLTDKQLENSIKRGGKCPNTNLVKPVTSTQLSLLDSYLLWPLMILFILIRLLDRLFAAQLCIPEH